MLLVAISAASVDTWAGSSSASALRMASCGCMGPDTAGSCPAESVVEAPKAAVAALSPSACPVCCLLLDGGIHSVSAAAQHMLSWKLSPDGMSLKAMSSQLEADA